MPASALLPMVLALAAASPPAAAAERNANAMPGRAALALFQQDWVLMNWALRFYDVDGDILLSPAEARPATEAFRKLADVNRDGRVTPAEYRAARQAILSRY
jgi:hypothetical protein